MRLFILIQIFVHASLAFPGEKDEVFILPGLRIQPTFKQYSGYLNGSDTRKLHYWFVESQGNAGTDPLVLWMNGGPGCSSLDGFITEHGPFRITEGGYLNYNFYSWNKIANIIYLESPSCVGFSYSTDGKCDADDDSTALLNFNALREFFVKFPQFKNRDFYITGESYGGFYVPTLTERIIRTNDSPYINLKGIAVGNGLSSFSLNENGNFHFAYNHGLFSDSEWRAIITACCQNLDPLHCDIVGSHDPNCSKMVQTALDLLQNINPYNIYGPCVSSNSSDNLIWEGLNKPSHYDRSRILIGAANSKNSRLWKLKLDFIKMKNLYQTFGLESVGMQVPCTSDSLAANFLNRERVRYALHIPKHVQNWTLCSFSVNTNFKSIYKNMNRQYNNLFKLKDFKILIYNGDVDMACSYLSDEWYFERFNRTVIQTRKPWIYSDANNSTQIGGFVKIWDKFSLVTIRGAGHMVPTDKPEAALHLFTSFIKGIPL